MSLSKCEVCTEPIEPCSRRYGGKACNKCAAYFYRTIKEGQQETLICNNGTNDCLKVPNRNGILCRKCRYSKCIEIGMSTQETFAKKNLEEKKALEEQKKLLENLNLFAHMANAFLTNALKFPALFKSYIAEENPQFLNLSLEPFQNPDNVKKAAATESMHPLTYILANHPISAAEIPTFCHFCLCQLEFNALTEFERTEMKILQKLCLERVCSRVFDHAHRLPHLSLLSFHFLNTFYALNF